MDLNKYLTLHPYPSLAGGARDTEQCPLIREGMLQFTEETACVWGGPYPGGYAHFVIRDYSRYPFWKDPKITLPEANSFYYKEKLRKLQNCTTKKEREKYQFTIDTVTAEFPISFRLSGNDDTSYSRFFATTKEALEELELLLACQPIDFFKDLDLHYPWWCGVTGKRTAGGWVFTN